MAVAVAVYDVAPQLVSRQGYAALVEHVHPDQRVALGVVGLEVVG